MSITTEIQRLQTAKAGLKTQLEAKGVSVSTAATLDEYPSLVSSIETTVYSGDVQSIIDAFAGGTLSGEITISSGNTTRNLREYLFYNCTGITAVNYICNYVGGYNNFFMSDHCFDGCKNLSSFNFTNLTNKKLITIGTAAFKNCQKLTSLPDGFLDDVETIGSEAFYNCPLTSITFSDKLGVINNKAFAYDNGYNAFSGQNITFPSGLTNFTNADYSVATFQNTKATGFTFLGHVESMGGNYSTSNYCYFRNNSECEVYDFSHNYAPVYRVPSNEFQGSKENYRIIVPQILYDKWITTQNWTNFASHIVSAANMYSADTYQFTYTGSTPYISSNHGAGQHWENIGEVISGGNGTVTIYGPDRKDVFNRPTITEVIFPTGITKIEEQICYNAGKLSACTIPDTVVEIESNAFWLTPLANSGFTFPEGLKRIESNAFGCSVSSSIASIAPGSVYNIPDSVEYIGNSFMYHYSEGGYITINIGSGITHIGDNFFRFGNGISNNTHYYITCKAVVPPEFGNTNIIIPTIYVPAESVDAYKTAAGWSKYADYIQAIQE